MSATAYGYEHASAAIDLTFSADMPDTPFRRGLRRGSRHFLGVDLVHAFANRRAIAAADIVWTHTEFEWHSLALLMRLRLLARRPILAQSVWLWDDWNRLSPARRWLARLLVNDPVVHVLQSRLNEAVARRHSRRQVIFVPFGVAPLRTRAAPALKTVANSAVRIVAVGNDRDRDWPVIFTVAAGRPYWQVRILSGRSLSPPPAARNVTVERGASPARILESFNWADILVTPVRPNLHASGITVALEALSAGLRQVSTDTGGLRDYLDGLVTFADPSDPAGMTTAIECALSAPAAPIGEIRRRGLTDRDYALRLATLSVAVLAGSEVPRSVGEFESQ